MKNLWSKKTTQIKTTIIYISVTFQIHGIGFESNSENSQNDL